MRITVKLLIIFQIILFVSFSNTSLEAETLFESFGVGLTFKSPLVSNA